ncbi:MAG: NRDE family protein [Pseudomonadales bacterium]|nr:NRDE family protein [Pseudomonadales bacterium]
MCLILFAVSPDPVHRLVVAANRDEYYGRPASRADWWHDYPQVLGGRDLEAGGTWLGVTQSGRFAAVTNFRETPPDPIPPRSRGALVADFLSGTQSCDDYVAGLLPIAQEFRGFNLLLNDGQQTWYYSNRIDKPRCLTPGYYGLSNQLLDCDWPKVITAREELAGYQPNGFAQEQLFGLLFNRGDDSPFSSRFIVSDSYGTTASTIVKIHHNGRTEFEERGFLAHGVPDTARNFSLTPTDQGQDHSDLP